MGLRMKKVLIVSPVATHPPYRGNRQRILQVANLFKNSGFDIELAIGSKRPLTQEAREFWPTIHQLKANPGWKPSHRAAALDSWYTPGLGEELARIVTEREIDVVLLNYVFHSRALQFLPESVVTVIDTHDVFTNRHEMYRGKKLAGGFFSCSAEDEATYLSRAHIALAITDQESQYFRSLQSASTVFHIPFVMPRTPLARNLDARTEGPKSFGMVLSANDLNLASLSDFIRQVDKRFGRTPPFRVHIAGGIDKLAYRYFPHRIPFFCRRWLTYRGEIYDIDDFYRSIDAVIVPMVAGSGMAIKFGEAVARGFPVISTAVGSRGHWTTQPYHTLTDNEGIVNFLLTLDWKQCSNLSVSSRLVHSRLQEITKLEWNKFSRFVRWRETPVSGEFFQ